ncbi:hypothetical protein HD806DRAFT_499769 [Xylariaceae sp. AK1471]|nr:hypothetical protein HD806DRAFT_499769 [Xylariaceae sp. AK1471]
MLVAKLDSLRVTHQDEEPRGGAPEEQDDGASMRPTGDLLGAQSESRPEVPAAAEEQPEERPEAPSEKHSDRQSNELSRPHSRSSSSSPNPPTPPFGGIPPNEGSSQQASSIPTFRRPLNEQHYQPRFPSQPSSPPTPISRPFNEQHSQLQSQSQSQSQSSLQTQVQAEREALTQALAYFMREEKIQPSQLSSLVLLLALFLLGSRGLATKSSVGAQEGKRQGQGEQEEMEHGELERSSDRSTNRNQRWIRNDRQSRFRTEW